MYIRKSSRTYKGKTYSNYVLVESGCFHETPGFQFPGQQQFNLMPQIGVAAAYMIEKRRSLFGLMLQS
jgi:hypothetical protein